LSLREGAPFALYAAAETLAILAANSMFGVLQAGLVQRIAVAPDQILHLPGGIEAEMFSVPGKVPLYLEAQHPELTAAPMGNTGIELRSKGARLIYVPGAAAVPDALQARLEDADVVLFDGTLFADDEMIRAGVGKKTGRRMGHLPIDGPDGSLARLEGLARRRIFTHINNTNPILIDGSPERRRVEAAGFEVAADGLEIVL
jgi:pyrroloquinoline quinone biosynthesis protein B